jgi:protein-S-isoprenylcysteine O-methyltransferase Ste14
VKRPAAIALGVAAWLVGVPLAHGVVPWLISWVGPRFAGGWSWLGLAPLALGAALLLWVALTSFAEFGKLPANVEANWKPKLFLARGPYAHTRNPMYVGELALWLGWAVWFGSPLVAVAAALLFAAMQRLIRREERDLETQFGDAYRSYTAAVPRWLAR